MYDTEHGGAYNCLDIHVAVSFLLEEDANSCLHCTDMTEPLWLFLDMRDHRAGEVSRTLGRAECGKIKPEPPDSPLKMSFEDIIDLFACAKPRCI